MAHAHVQNFEFGVSGFARTIVLALVVLLLRTQMVLAAAGGVPPPVVGPPHPPCISTASLANDNEGSIFGCTVRNVGATAHNITLTFRDNNNVGIPPSIQI